MNDVAPPTAADRHLETLGRLTRGALHEIANTLLALVGTAELALAEAEAEADGKLRGRLDTVHSTGLEIARIVRALQAFVRLRDEAPRRLSLADAADEAAALVRLVSSAPDVHVATRAEAAPRVHEAPGVVVGPLVDLLLDGLGAARRGDTLELLVREEGADGLVSLAGVGELRWPKVDA